MRRTGAMKGFRFDPRNLAQRFMFGVIPVSLAGIILVGVFAFHFSRSHISESVRREVDAFARNSAADVARFFKQRENDLETLAETSLLDDYYNNIDYGLYEEAGQYRLELGRYFLKFAGRAGGYIRVVFVDAAGRRVCGIENSRLMSPGAAYGTAAILKQAAARGPAGSIAFHITTDPLYGPVITYARPVLDQSGEFRGAVITESSLKPLQETLDRLRVGRNGRTYIRDARGRPALWGTAAAGPAADTDFISEVPVPGTSLRVVVAAPVSDFEAPLRRISRITVLAVALCGALVWLSISLAILGMTRPIEDLVRATRRFAAGGLFEKVAVASRDEIGVLAASFNTMGAQLMERKRELEARIKELLFLQRMSSAVIENLEEEHICRVCLEAAVSGLGFDRGILYLVDEEKKLVIGRYVHSTEGVGFDEAKMRSRAVPLAGDDILAEVVRTRKAMNVKNPGEAPGINRRFVEEVATRAFCLVPVMTEQKVLGVIGADNYYSGRTVTDEQLRNLALFGNFTALALENAGLVSSVKRSEARYRTVLDNSPDAIVGLDASLRVNVWNKGARALFGYAAEEITGRSVSMLFDPLAFEAILRQVRKNGAFSDSCVPGLNSAGGKLELDVAWAGAGTVEDSRNQKEWTVVIRDTSEQRKTQAQLIQAEKLSAVGQLISGVAHELNNPLGAIIGYAELLYRNRAGDNVMVPSADLAAIYESSVRCGKIIKNLLVFVRETRNKKQTISLEQVLGSALGLMDYKLKKTENISITSHVSGHLPPVIADYHQIEQILVNLIQNACDALSQKSGGKHIKIDMRHHVNSVFVSVTDNGPGIPRELLPRIFDPFFTTKEEGQGTGLGLPICRRIAEEHGGSITCSGAPGGGAVFTLELPIVKSSGEEPEPERAVRQPAPGRRILVVDDEPAMLAMLRRMLEPAGQVFDGACSAAEAVEKLGGGSYDLVICDVEMGAGKGFSVRETMLRAGCPAAFIYTTGNLLNAALMLKLNNAGVPFLAKPFSIDELYSAMNDALAGA